MDAEDARTIAQRARRIRHRRGLSLDVVAGLAGISKPCLSALERGQRGFNRRGLIEDLAEALGCSVVDLTGQRYAPPDRGTADALATLPGISFWCGLMRRPRRIVTARQSSAWTQPTGWRHSTFDPTRWPEELVITLDRRLGGGCGSWLRREVARGE